MKGIVWKMLVIEKLETAIEEKKRAVWPEKKETEIFSGLGNCNDY